MPKENASTPAALLADSRLVRKGGADVFRQREKTRLKRVLKAIVVVGLVDLFLWRWYAAGNTLSLPQLGPDWIFFLMPVVIIPPSPIPPRFLVG